MRVSLISSLQLVSRRVFARNFSVSVSSAMPIKVCTVNVSKNKTCKVQLSTFFIQRFSRPCWNDMLTKHLFDLNQEVLNIRLKHVLYLYATGIHGCTLHMYCVWECHPAKFICQKLILQTYDINHHKLFVHVLVFKIMIDSGMHNTPEST